MNNFKALCLSFVAVSALAFSANAAETNKNYYVSVDGEIDATQDLGYNLGGGLSGDVKFDTGYGIAASAGYYVPNSDFRIEGEAAYKQLNFDELVIGGTSYPVSNDFEYYAFMANGYYDVKTESQIKPYVGLGLGLATDTELDDSEFAYQAMAGLSYDLDDTNAIYGGYKFFSVVSSEDDIDNLNSHGLEVGYRYSF